MRKLAFLVALGLLALSGAGIAALASAGTSSNPAQQCRAEQADPNFAVNHGGKTFAQFYGTNGNQGDAFDNCVSAKAKGQSSTVSTTTVVSTNTSTTNHSTTNPAALCRAERVAGADAFKAKYGTNKNKANAFGKCVSAKAKAQSSH